MRTRWIVIATLLAGCSDAPPSIIAWGPTLSMQAPDDLLTRARASLASGHVDPQLLVALRAAAAGDARIARAVRILDAIDDPMAEVPEPEPPRGDVPLDVPRLAVATAPPGPKTTPAASSKSRSSKSGASSPAATAPKRSAPPAVRARLEKLGLSKTSRGAALSLRGSGGLVVGVASQPASGIVRLVMEADAAGSALSSRPKIAGAQVTAVRRTGKTVFVTLSLERGWSLGGIVRTKSGARVDLRRPA